MLINTLTNIQIRKEIDLDQEILFNTTVPRLVKEYLKQRQKFKISKTSQYLQVYSIKTKRKNNFRIIIRMDKDSYRTLDDISLNIYCYRYIPKGIQIFITSALQDNLLTIYTGHFFNRYNERMGLGLTNLFSIIDLFFIKNPHLINNHDEHSKVKTYSLNIYSEGYGFSEYDPESRWVLTKTFIRKDMIRQDQLDEVRQLKTEIDSMSLDFSTELREEFSNLIKNSLK